MADTGIATRLRAAGLDVREVAGWKTRGRDFAGASPAFNPAGGVHHHTAGQPSAANPHPSLGILINGRPDLNGPLCNWSFVPLEKRFYVIAAGVANHAGLPDNGSIKGMTGNSSAYGCEVEWDGVHPMPLALVKLAAKGWAAVLRGTGIAPTQVVQHWEWAPSRKVDFGTNLHPGTSPTHNEFRHLIAVELKKLETVKRWTVSYKNQKGIRVEDMTGDLSAWHKNHPGADQRGKVISTPKRA